MKNNVQAIILAAGKSSRFNTKKTKLAETMCGQAIILFSTKLLESLELKTTVVIGHEKETIEHLIKQEHGTNINFITQEEQLGTGHALSCSQQYWDADHILVINGDMPLVTKEIITNLYTKHIEQNAAISFVISSDPNQTNTSYGRIVQTNNSIAIVEAKDFTGDPNEPYFINAGIYLIAKKFLKNSIAELKNNNASNEFYITDLVEIACKNQQTVTTVKAHFDTIRGVNTLHELWIAEQIKLSQIILHWMNNGIKFSNIHNVFIDLNVVIGAESSISCGVQLRKKTIIGKNCHIQEFSSLENTYLDDNVTIHSHSIINNSHIKSGAQVGPFAHIRTNTIIGENVAIGNFVEVKNSSLENNTKAKHLAYLGDATIGSKVNIGAGTITCNYNGTTKERTVIKNNAFIGSNNTLVAPVTIGENTFTAAGSTITLEVPDNSLAIARSHQTNKTDYANKLHAKHATQKKHPIKNTTIDDQFSFVGARLIPHDIPVDEQ